MQRLLTKLRHQLTDSFWFVPTVMAAFACAAALSSVALDNRIGSDWVEDIGWIWSGGADGAREVLSVVAGSIMTVVSIVFSLTITTLAQTSSHFGPRVLRNFTSDRGVQFTLGTFISTFLYCLLVLRTVRSIDESSFVPYVSVNLGLLWALASLAVLIYFIHHLSQSIQAENLIAQIGGEFEHAVSRLFPDPIGHSPTEATGSPEPDDWSDAVPIPCDATGYLQRVDESGLMELAVSCQLVVKLDRQPGTFVPKGAALAHVLSQATSVDAALRKKMRACFILGRHRTPDQDSLYMIQQLVEIATRALSPGTNESFTALTCIDWLGNSLRAVARRQPPSRYRIDDHGHVRVLAEPVDFTLVADAAFDQIRALAHGKADVIVRLLHAYREAAPDVSRAADRVAMLAHIERTGRLVDTIGEPDDRAKAATLLVQTRAAYRA